MENGQSMNQAILQTMQHRRLLIPKRLPGIPALIRERSSLFNPCRKRRRRQLLLLSTNWLNSRPLRLQATRKRHRPQCGKKRQSCRTANYKLLYKKRGIPYAVRVWRNN